MKTLADMTEEEQFECVGMLADDAESPYLAIISAVYAGGYVGCFYPEIDRRYEAESNQITPRFDLPRAYGPDGKPVEEMP